MSVWSFKEVAAAHQALPSLGGHGNCCCCCCCCLLPLSKVSVLP
jgi:hypothetical protein